MKTVKTIGLVLSSLLWIAATTPEATAQVQGDDPMGVECEDDIGGDAGLNAELVGWQTRGTAIRTDTNCYLAPVGSPRFAGWLEHRFPTSVSGAAYTIGYSALYLQLDAPDQFRLAELCTEGGCAADGSLLAIGLGRNLQNTAYQLDFRWMSDDAAGKEAPAIDINNDFELRVAWRRSTLPVSSVPRRDGYLKVWLDGIPIFEKTDLLLSAGAPKLVKTGACNDVDRDTGGELGLRIIETAELF